MMTQHIIDTDELEKRINRCSANDFYSNILKANNDGYVKGLKCALDLILSSPQVNGINATREELDKFLRDMRDGKPNPKAQETLSKGRAILRQMEEAMLSAYKPQADDVRKDAERYRFLREGKYIHNGEPFIARNFGASFSQWTGEDADKVIDQAIDKAME